MLADQNVNMSVKKVLDLFGPVILHFEIFNMKNLFIAEQ